MISKQASDCGDDCLQCYHNKNRQGNIVCLQCAPAFRLFEGNCIPCGLPGCASCGDNEEICRGCMQGWYNSTLQGYGSILEVKNCSRCLDGCVLCKNRFECQICGHNLKFIVGKKNEPGKCEEGDYTPLFVFFGVLLFTIVILGLVFIRRYGLLMTKEQKERRERQKEMSKMIKEGKLKSATEIIKKYRFKY